MLAYTTAQAKDHFEELMAAAQFAPVRIFQNEYAVAVTVSAQDYAAMCAFYSDRLRLNLQSSAAEAGLSEAQIERLLF